MKHTINLVPQKSPLETQARDKRRTTIVITVVGFLVVFLLWLVPFLILQGFKRQEQNILTDIATKEQSITSLSEQEQLYRLVFNKASAADHVLRTKETLTNSINNLTNFVGEQLSIAQIIVKKETIEMVVSSSDIASVMTYLDSLEDDERNNVFKTLTIDSISADSLNGYRVGIEGELVHE